ncbi:MAG: Holliday junction branch migration protein RuvA [Eubacteriales bacterium]
MIHYIKGKLGMLIPGAAIIENNEIGYKIYIPDNSPIYQKQDGADVMLYTEMIVREDDISLYGFSDKEGLFLFKTLMKVNGVGAKASMSILSTLPAQELKKAIVSGDITMLSRANGIGKKTAERIVLELKDKFAKDEVFEDSNVSAISSALPGEKAEAVEALISLGYSKNEAQQAVFGVNEEGIGVSKLIKLALLRLS